MTNFMSALFSECFKWSREARAHCLLTVILTVYVIFLTHGVFNTPVSDKIDYGPVLWSPLLAFFVTGSYIFMLSHVSWLCLLTVF